jgi:hypothetical protein
VTDDIYEEIKDQVFAPDEEDEKDCDDCKKDECSKIKKAFEYLSYSKKVEAYAYEKLGDAFEKLCEEIKECKEKDKTECHNGYTTGPVQKDINAKSIITRVINKNDFPVKVSITVNNLVYQRIIPLYCNEIELKPCSTASDCPINICDPSINSYSITFEIKDCSGKAIMPPLAAISPIPRSITATL